MRVENVMNRRYAGWTTEKRMAAAVREVMEGKETQSSAARKFGVSRQRVNVNVQERKRNDARKQARSVEALNSRVKALEAPAPVALPETQVAVEVAQSDISVVPDPGTSLIPPGGTVDGAERPGDGSSETPAPSLILPPAPSLILDDQKLRVPPPAEFMRMYFSKIICPDCGVHHEVPPFHDEIIETICDPSTRRLLVNVAPYHAKSTIGTVYSTLWEICNDPNSRTAIVSKSEKLARRFLQQIQKFLSDPMIYGDGPNLITDWGEFYQANTWSATEFVVAGRQSSEKDPTVSAYGALAQIYGYRFDRMLFDDIADLENQRSPDRVAEQLSWSTQECASRVGKTGKLIYMGTRVSPNDIYSYLKNLPAFKVVSYPCILDEVEQTTLWPGHFPYRSAVEQRESMSMEQFQLVYQNVDTPGFGAAFPLEVLEGCKDPGRPLGHYDPAWRLVLGVDPAGGGAQAGYTAMVVLGVNMTTGQRYVVDIVNHRQMRAPQIKDQILDWADRYPLTEIVVEGNGLQSQLFQYDTELIQKITQRGVRFVPHITGRNKWDDSFGVESMGPMFYNGQVSLPTMDINSRKKIGEMCDQLAQFPMGQVNDVVMALWFADLGCRRIFQSFKLPAFDSRMRMPARIRAKRRVVDFGANEVRAPSFDELNDVARQPQRRHLTNVAGDVTVYG